MIEDINRTSWTMTLHIDGDEFDIPGKFAGRRIAYNRIA